MTRIINYNIHQDINFTSITLSCIDNFFLFEEIELSVTVNMWWNHDTYIFEIYVLKRNQKIKSMMIPDIKIKITIFGWLLLIKIIYFYTSTVKQACSVLD